MTMPWVLDLYWICLVVGIGYAIIGQILGGLGGHGIHFGHPGHAGHAGHAGHGQANAPSGEGPQVIFGPFSPLVIAFFLTCFGATGIILTELFKSSPHLLYAVLLLASVSGFVLAWLLISLFNRLLGNFQGTSEVKLYALIGTEGEVTVNIPANGIGEIAYVAMGTRCLSPAMSDDPVVIPRFSAVRITRLVGNMFYVRPIAEDQLRHLEVKHDRDEAD